MIRPSLWLCAPPEGLVAFGREGARNAGELAADVGSLAASLEPVSGGRLVLHCDDAYAFAVGLLAAAQVGARVVLPPSRQPGALRRLTPEVDGALLDAPEPPDTLQGRPCWHPLEVPRAGWCPRPLDRDTPWVELFTSGTTGAGRSVTKEVRHLDDEVAVLEERLGPAWAPDARVLATVAPQHLYGLLFRVLWPLASGRPFLRSAVLHPRELGPYLAPGPFGLAATPVSLRHWVDGAAAPLAAGACCAVFSSGGPLSAALASRVADHAGAPPWEVYGSTETGGVAVRQRRRGDESWRPLPGVEVTPGAGGVVVSSPFVSEGQRAADGRGRFALRDRAVFAADGGFQLLGRADRVVKVGEKRLSLPDMESRLRGHAAVAEVALVGLERTGETRVGAAIVVTPEGREVVAAGGRRALAKVLTEHLAADFDRVLLPRAWRVVEALPRDAQGKTSVEALRALLGEEGRRPRRPEPLEVRRRPDGFEARLRLPPDLAFLEGHYPEVPLVAGVVQVHLVMQALEEHLGRVPRLERLEALKFHALLRPGQEVSLQLRLAEDDRRFDFSLCDAREPSRLFSSGRGWLRAAEPDA